MCLSDSVRSTLSGGSSIGAVQTQRRRTGAVRLVRQKRSSRHFERNSSLRIQSRGAIHCFLAVAASWLDRAGRRSSRWAALAWAWAMGRGRSCRRRRAARLFWRVRSGPAGGSACCLAPMSSGRRESSRSGASRSPGRYRSCGRVQRKQAGVRRGRGDAQGARGAGLRAGSGDATDASLSEPLAHARGSELSRPRAARTRTAPSLSRLVIRGTAPSRSRLVAGVRRDQGASPGGLNPCV